MLTAQNSLGWELGSYVPDYEPDKILENRIIERNY